MGHESRIKKILINSSKAILLCLTLIIVFLGIFYTLEAIVFQSKKSIAYSMLLTSSSIILITFLLVMLYWINKKRLQAEEKIKDFSKRDDLEEELKGLKASRASYKSMIESANDTIWTLDRNGKFLSTNRSFEEITGFRSRELIGKDFSSIVLKESVNLYKKALSGAFKGKAETVTIKVLHKYLKPLILSVNVSSIMSCGDIIGTVNFGRDVTIKRTFEEHLLRQNKELSALHKIASSADYSLDFKTSTRQFLKIIVEAMKAEGGVVFLLDDMDKKFLKPLCATGVTDEDEFLQAIKGFKIGEGIVGTIALLEEPMTVEDVHEDIRVSRPEILGEKFRGFAGAPIKPKGEVFGVIIIYYKSPHLLKEEDLGFLTILSNELALDLSNAIFAEETLKESERMETITQTNTEMYEKVMEENIQWENIFDSMPYPICIHDRNNLIIRTNNAFAAKFGLHPRDLVGKKCHEILSQQDSSMSICSPSEEWHKESFKLLEARLFDDQYEVCSFPLLTTNRDPIGTIHLFMGVAKTKELREEIIQREKLSAISQLVAGVAHELNNPLMGMIGYLQLLLAKEDNETHRDYEEKAIKEAEKASKILKNLLTFSRKRTPEKKPADMNTIIDKAVEQRSQHSIIDDIEIVRNLKSDLPKALLDEHQMQLVLLNILLNAEQAMIARGTKGKITINTYTITPNNKDLIRIEVFDEGPGISEEIISKIFDPFFTTKSSERKTGLGLSICTGIINQHGGYIRARNYDGGAVFTIDLPALKEESIEAKEKEKAGIA